MIRRILQILQSVSNGYLLGNKHYNYYVSEDVALMRSQRRILNYLSLSGYLVDFFIKEPSLRYSVNHRKQSCFIS